MNLISNFIGEISPSLFESGMKNITGLGMSNTGFSELLEKQMNFIRQENSTCTMENLGMPAGFDISFADISETLGNEQQNQKIEVHTETSTDMQNNNDTTTSEAITFFTSLLENCSENSQLHREVFDFAKKQAASTYSKGAGSMVTDLQEFISNVINH